MHRHLNSAALARLLAIDRSAEQNEQLFHLLTVCPGCREVGGWLLELHQANALPPVSVRSTPPSPGRVPRRPGFWKCSFPSIQENACPAFTPTPVS